jgi:hypothetical protein
MISPPPVPRSLVAGPEVLILIISSSAVLIGSVLVLATTKGGLAFPCLWKACTGLPCFACGGTRALTLLLGGRWADAVQLNPGVVAAVALVAVANVYALAVLVLRVPPSRPGWLVRGHWRWLLLGAVLANWLYLLAAGLA